MKMISATLRHVRLLALFCILFSCSPKAELEKALQPEAALAVRPASSTPITQVDALPIAAPAEILARREVPILCYHQIREYRPTDSRTARDYIVPPDVFRAQMKALADSGYHTITPDELFAYLNGAGELPEKPVLLTFDDTDLEQYTVAVPEMDKHGFKGVFFIMTVSINRPRYMSESQIRDLASKGHTIASHTWDHHNVKQYKETDWVQQLDKPSKRLEEITGKEVRYFAYPFGLWNNGAFPELHKRKYLAAFQLSAKRDTTDPLYTIRRIIVPGSWTPERMMTAMRSSFK